MNKHINRYTKVIVTAAAFALLGACATPLTAPEGSANARNKLTQLQTDPQLASRAQVEIQDAERAVVAAEVPTEDTERARHLVLMADHKVDIARARAQSRLYEDQRQARAVLHRRFASRRSLALDAERCRWSLRHRPRT